MPLLEIPSGILADRWSRRGVLLIGNAGVVLGVLVGGLSTDVAAYVVAALLLGVDLAMQSGTFDAIVYDTVLEDTGVSDRFESLVGRVRLAESASLVLGALGGGALAAITSPARDLLRDRAVPPRCRRRSNSRSASRASTRSANPGRCANTSGSPSGSFAVTEGWCRSPLCSCSRRSSPRASSSWPALARRRRRWSQRVRAGMGRPHGVPRIRRSTGRAERWLFPNQQRQHAQVGQASRFREQQSEGLLAGQAGRLLQQPPNRIGADQHIRIVEGLGRQLGHPQHPKRIEPH